MNLRGQGTTEYLIILAVIIVIALVVVGVMGWFPGLGTGITEQQSRAYWQSASPLAIKDWKIEAAPVANATFLVQNLTTDAIGLTIVNIGGTEVDIDDVNIAAGSTATVNVAGVNCTSGSTYQFDVRLTYDVGGLLLGKTEVGGKPIVGTCP